MTNLLILREQTCFTCYVHGAKVLSPLLCVLVMWIGMDWRGWCGWLLMLPACSMNSLVVLEKKEYNKNFTYFV